MDKYTSNSKNQLVINSASYLLKRKRLLLSFKPFDLEEDYLSSRKNDNLHYVKAFLAFAVTFLVVVAVLVAIFWPGLFTTGDDSPLVKMNMAVNIAFIVIAPLFILVIRNERVQQIYTMLLCIIFLTWKCAYPHLVEDHSYSTSTLYLSISYLILAAFITKQRTSYAFVSYLTIALATLFVIKNYSNSSYLTILDYIYATAITCILAFALAAYQERMLRVNFLKNIILKTQQKELESLNNRYIRLSKEDPLTGLANRRHLKERLDNEWQRLKRESGPISIIMFDIDCFKKYNDHYGHQMGDSCLVQIATCLNSVIKRPNDLSARYGGEEFIVVLPNTNEVGGLKVAQIIKRAVDRCAIENIASDVKPIITLSFGVSTLIPDENSDKSTKTLIKLADDALYQAKANGKDRIVVADKNSSIIQLINKAHNDIE